MYQIDVPSASQTLPASTALGQPGYFTDGDVAGGIDPTLVPAEFLNAVMLELLGVVNAGGLVPSKVTNGQLTLAIQNMIEARAGNYALDTGVANAYSVVLSPPVTAYVPGMAVKFRATHANSQASTINAGAGVVPLARDDGTALQGGDIPSNSIVSATYDAAGGVFLMNSMVPSQLGALAKEGIGQGLKDDGTGNLTLRLASTIKLDGGGNAAVNYGRGLAVDTAGNLIAVGYTYINGVATLSAGAYLVDTSGGSFVLTLPANPAKGTPITFTDAAASWGIVNFTIARNGQTIMGQASDLTVNVSDQQFTIWFNGSDWRLI